MNETSLSWEHWRSFLAVVRQGSLSAAARALALTQPTVGRHIDALEAASGAALFTRSRSGLNPTDLALVPQAEAMEAAAASLLRIASGERGEARGAVRLTAFHESWPAIAIELAVSNRNENLLRREADIAVRMVRPDQEAIVARTAGVARIGLFAHRHYAAAHGRPSKPEDLFAHSLIGIDRNIEMLAGVRIGGRALTHEDLAFRCDSEVAQMMAVRAGFGIGVCQIGLAADDPDLVPVLPESVRFDLEMWVSETVAVGAMPTPNTARPTCQWSSRRHFCRRPAA